MFRACAGLCVILALVGCSKKKQIGANGHPSSNTAEPLERFQQNGEYGFRDLTGTVVIQPKFAEAGDFSWGLARVKPDAKGVWGYIDASGDITIPPQYDGASDFVDGVAVVLDKGQFAYIGPDGGTMGLFDEDQLPKPLAVGDTLYVIHTNGLIVRSSGDANAAAMGTVKPGEAVQYMFSPHAKRSQTIDGVRGTWLLVHYQNKSGYLFDAYLARYPMAAEQQPVERIRVVVSSLENEQYSTYALTKFASGGRLKVHDGPNWTESQQVVPRASVDQVVARLKLYPTGDVGSLMGYFNGSSGTYTTDKGETIVVRVRRDLAGFLEHLSISRKNEETTFDVSINKYSIDAVEIATSLTPESADETTQPANEF